MRQRNSENRAFGGRLLKGDFTSMVLHNFVDHGQPQASPVFFSLADERLEKRILNRVGDTSPVIADVDLNHRPILVNAHFNASRPAGKGLAGIQQQIEKGPLKLAMIKPALGITDQTNFGCSTVKLRI